jgi:hypothetical protein
MLTFLSYLPQDAVNVNSAGSPTQQIFLPHFQAQAPGAAASPEARGLERTPDSVIFSI